jgi:predicted PurR-regulated permease PerM
MTKKASSKINNKQGALLYLSTIIGIVALLYVGKQFLPVIMSAIITAIIINPLYHWLKRKAWLNTTAASMICLLIVVGLIITPLLLISAYTAYELSTIDYGELVKTIEQYSIYQRAQQIFNVDLSNSVDRIRENLQLDSLAEQAFTTVFSISQNVIGVMIKMILFIFIFLSSLKYQQKIKEYVFSLMPFTESINTDLVSTVKNVVKSMSITLLTGALAQAIAAYAILLIFDVPRAFLLTIITFISAVLPIGSGIVLIPLGMFYIVSGQYIEGAVILAYTFIVVSSLDNLVRSTTGARGLAIGSTLVFIGIVLGLVMFGLVGILVGPAIIAVIVRMIDIYTESNWHISQLYK